MDSSNQGDLEIIYYLYNCNITQDIENNIGEIEIPNFNIEHINYINAHYNTYLSQLYEIISQEQYDENEINNMINVFELNELYIEHVDNMKCLHDKMVEYNSIGLYKKINEYMTIRIDKIQFYSQDIMPIIQTDEANLNSVIVILSSSK